MRAALLVLAACTTGRLESNVVFTTYSPLSRNVEIARRALPPLTARRVSQGPLAAQAIDLAHEKFDVYIPPGAPPPAGYGLVVFIAPWPDPTRPRIWRSALDDHRFIFTSFQQAGNGTSTLDRRMPLALLAYENVRARYAIDPARVYVMGFSGGSRAAEMTALAYPDVFRGAILNAGADPIDGQTGMYKPPAELFRAFQHTRLVYVTGDADTDALHADDVSEDSMRANCVLDIAAQLAPQHGHASLDYAAFAHALDAVEEHHVDEAALARCNARVAAELAAQLADVEAAITRRDPHARDQLNAIDARFGGLAAPRILELADRL